MADDYRLLQIQLSSSSNHSCRARCGIFVGDFHDFKYMFMAIDLANTLFSIPIGKEKQKELALKWNRK